MQTSHYDLQNRRGAALCHRVGCRKHARLAARYRGLFCAGHLAEMQEIRASVVYWKTQRGAAALEQERGWRQRELAIRKTACAGHMQPRLEQQAAHMLRPVARDLALRMYDPANVPELDAAARDWTAWPLEHCFAGVVAFGWAAERAYPPHPLLRQWLALLLPLGAGAEPLPAGAGREEVLANEGRVLATARHRGLWWLGRCWDYPFADAALRRRCDVLNGVQGTAMCIVETLEGRRAHAALGVQQSLQVQQERLCALADVA